MILQRSSKLFLIPLFVVILIVGCVNKYVAVKTERDSTFVSQKTKDEVWKQYMKFEVTSQQKMPPDTNCFLLMDYKKVSYYKKNKMEFSGEVYEILKNDSLIVYKLNNMPDIQIGFNRKDSLIILTKGRAEGGIPSGDMEFFSKNVKIKTPFDKN